MVPPTTTHHFLFEVWYSQTNFTEYFWKILYASISASGQLQLPTASGTQTWYVNTGSLYAIFVNPQEPGFVKWYHTFIIIDFKRI